MEAKVRIVFGLLAGCFAAVTSAWGDIRAPNLESAQGRKSRTPVLVPQSATNLLSSGCAVTASARPLTGELSCVTDGGKETDNPHVDLPDGAQWVQIDLGKEREIWALCIWHWFGRECIYYDVICQLSSDFSFSDHVTTVFNNDHNNSSGYGVGKDKEYYETYQGRVIAVNGVRARYLRVCGKGNTTTFANSYAEVEVYGRSPGVIQTKDESRVPLQVVVPKPYYGWGP